MSLLQQNSQEQDDAARGEEFSNGRHREQRTEHGLALFPSPWEESRYCAFLALCIYSSQAANSQDEIPFATPLNQ